MEPFAKYLFEVSICSAVVYFTYTLFLKGRTFFQLNRFFLLGGLVISLILPFISLPERVVPATNTIPLISFEQNNTEYIPFGFSDGANIISYDLSNLAFIIYAAGVVFFCYRFVLAIGKILQLKGQSPCVHVHGVKVYLQDSFPPFSFFNLIFASRQTDLIVIKHEQVHVKQLHSLDNIFIEIICIFSWVNPLLIFYKRALKNEHEFLADRGATRNIDLETYIHGLLNTTFAISRISVISHFGSQQIKNRIIMLTKNKTPLYYALLYLLIFPAVAVLLFAFQDKPASPITSITQIVTSPQTIPDGEPIERTKVKSTVGFGERLHPATKKMVKHTGVDCVADEGVDVMATADGVVLETNFNDLKGNFVVIRHNEQVITQYYHLLKSTVKAGATVKKGDVIGLVGSTGVLSANNHLHYEVVKDGKAVNPVDYLPKDYIQQ